MQRIDDVGFTIGSLSDFIECCSSSSSSERRRSRRSSAVWDECFFFRPFRDLCRFSVISKHFLYFVNRWKMESLSSAEGERIEFESAWPSMGEYMKSIAKLN